MKALHKVNSMTDFKLGTEVVHHHGKQTEPQAVAHFQAELHNINKSICGNDADVRRNLAHVNFQKLDAELHKSHKGIPAELDAHMHASAVYKIDGKMQLVFTDDLYKNNKTKDQTQHAYTIDEKTGKINAMFDVRQSENGGRVLVRYKLNGENQTVLERTKSGETNVLRGNGYTEYQTPDGRIVKSSNDVYTVHNPKGSTENYTHDGFSRYTHNVLNDNGKYESSGGPLSKVRVSADGTITTNRTTGDYSTTTYPDGRRVERDGTESSGNIVRIKDPKGSEVRLVWGENRDQPDTVRLTDTATFLPNQSMELQRVTSGFKCDDLYQSYDAPSTSYHYYKVNVDKTNGTVKCHAVSDKDLEEQRISPPANYRYQYE